jgi:hypothetical protein
MRSEPFQIFCLHDREELSKQNPKLSAAELMSKLGGMWQALAPEHKSEYANAAKSAMIDDRRPGKFSKPQIVEPGPSERIVRDLIQLLQPRPRPSPHGFPVFSIIARGSSGRDAALASQQLVSERYSDTALSSWTEKKKKIVRTFRSSNMQRYSEVYKL